MLYIHQSTCISPQHTFDDIDINKLIESTDNKMNVLEPTYPDIPPGILRRMGKAVRIGVGAALPLIKKNPGINGVIMGTANGGLEDCIKFLNQIIKYEEGTLTPTNFVQSTTNAIAAQIAIHDNIKGYNITHVHRGLAFENALLDVLMLLKEYPDNKYLVGGVEEISVYNYNIQYLGGWYKKHPVSNTELYLNRTDGSLAGEGAAMFVTSSLREGAVAQIEIIATIHSDEPNEVADFLRNFLENNFDLKIDLLLSGENGDNRSINFYEMCEEALGNETNIARFKHISGEHQSTTAIGLWLSCHILKTQSLPDHMVKRKIGENMYKRILIYNNYEGYQHSLILVNKV